MLPKDRSFFNQQPPLLQEGDTIGIVSLSGPLAARCPRRLQRAVGYLESKGLKVRLGVSTGLDTGTRAGEARDRAKDLHTMMIDPSVKAIVTSIGGAGASEILPELDLSILRAHPTILVGYSDTTSVLLWIWAQTGLITFYGPAALPQFGEVGGCFDFTWNHFISVVTSVLPVGELPESDICVTEYLEWDIEDDRRRDQKAHTPRFPIRRGVAEGPLVTANLATFANILRAGDHIPNLQRCVLLLEVSDTTSFNAFCMDLELLADLDVFSRIAALAWGRFRQLTTQCWSTDVVKSIINQLPIKQTVPIAMDIEFGHIDPILTLPMGVQCRLTVDESVRLELLEAAVV